MQMLLKHSECNSLYSRSLYSVLIPVPVLSLNERMLSQELLVAEVCCENPKRPFF